MELLCALLLLAGTASSGSASSSPEALAALPTLVISLEGTHDRRWEAAQKHLTMFGLEPERLPAKRIKTPILEGCIQSHSEALKRAAESSTNTFIFEDDVIPHPMASLENISKVMEQVPEDFTIVWFGHCYCHEDGICSTEHQGLSVIKSAANCGHAYLVSPKGAARLLGSDVMVNRVPGRDALDRIYLMECWRLENEGCYVAAPTLQRIAGTTTWGHGLFQQDWHFKDSTNPEMHYDGMFGHDTIPGEDSKGMRVEGIPCYGGSTSYFFGENQQLRSYIGECEGSHLHGHGWVVYSSGSYYNGTFNYNKQHGSGLFFEPGQQIYYVGGWAEGVQHGSAFIFNADHTFVARSEWNDGAQVSASAIPWEEVEMALEGALYKGKGGELRYRIVPNKPDTREEL
jgi:hypothetical protein